MLRFHCLANDVEGRRILHSVFSKILRNGNLVKHGFWNLLEIQLQSHLVTLKDNRLIGPWGLS